MFVSQLPHITEVVKRNAIAHFPTPVAGKIACHLSQEQRLLECGTQYTPQGIAIGGVIDTLRKCVCMDSCPTRNCDQAYTHPCTHPPKPTHQPIRLSVFLHASTPPIHLLQCPEGRQTLQCRREGLQVDARHGTRGRHLVVAELLQALEQRHRAAGKVERVEVELQEVVEIAHLGEDKRHDALGHLGFGDSGMRRVGGGEGRGRGENGIRKEGEGETIQRHKHNLPSRHTEPLVDTL